MSLSNHHIGIGGDIVKVVGLDAPGRTYALSVVVPT